MLARPVCRSEVILARFAGGLLFGAIQLGWILAIASAVMWVKFELFPARLLAAAVPLLLKFALLLAIATAVGVVLRSVVLGLVGAAGCRSSGEMPPGLSARFTRYRTFDAG